MRVHHTHTQWFNRRNSLHENMSFPAAFCYHSNRQKLLPRARAKRYIEPHAMRDAICCVRYDRYKMTLALFGAKPFHPQWFCMSIFNCTVTILSRIFYVHKITFYYNVILQCKTVLLSTIQCTVQTYYNMNAVLNLLLIYLVYAYEYCSSVDTVRL